MKAILLIHTINLIFIVLTEMAIYHCQLAWITGKYNVLPEFGAKGGAPHTFNTIIY
jgi:hypothetical protein